MSLQFVSKGPIDNSPALAQMFRQAINWTNADPIHWRICGTGGNELSKANSLVFI